MYELRFPKQMLLEESRPALHWSQALSGMWTTGQTCRSRGGSWGVVSGPRSLCLCGPVVGEQPWPASQGCCEDGGDYGEGWGSVVRYSLCCGATWVVLLGVGKGRGSAVKEGPS